MNEFAKYCLRVFSKVDPRATFLSVKDYCNNYSEISDFSVVFHVNYLNAVRKAQANIEKIQYDSASKFSKITFNLAKDELLSSFEMTLSGYNPLYTCHGVYQEILDVRNEVIPGVKLHIQDQIVHINALKIRKKVIVPGNYSKRNSDPKTIIKRYLKSQTPLANWVQFKLLPNRFKRLSVQKMEIS